MRNTGSVARWLRIGIGAVLLLLTTAPFYRLAGGRETGLAGRATLDIISTHSDFLWSGTLVLALVGVLAGLLLDRNVWAGPWRQIEAALLRPSSRLFVLLLAALAFVATATFTLAVLEGKPNLIDAMAYLVQARYMAEGMLAGPVLEDPAFWFIQNTILTDNGWVSQYPPGHTALLAAGIRLGIVSLVGAFFMAVTAAFGFLSLRRLLPADPLVARLGGIGIALSPFLIAQAGSFMSHGSAAALSTLAVYSALRARDGGAAWGLALGTALGMLLTSRPLFALVIGFGVALPIAVDGVRRRRVTLAGVGSRVGLAVIAGAPFVALLMAYNTHLFGSPLELGYVTAWGAGHELGFHRDPWGNLYSLRAAIGYTSGDLTALSLSLFESPFPVVAGIGIWLIVARRLEPGESILLAWALLPVVANFFYWHHSYFMGPRMLAEAAPPLAGLATLAHVRLFRRLPDELPVTGPRFRPRTALATAFVLAAAAAAYFGPLRLINRGGEFLPSMRIEAPTHPDSALVFVHGAWSGRVFGRLAAAGLPMHSLETLLRRNDLCTIQQQLDAVDAAPARLALDFERLPTPPHLVEAQPFPGNRIPLHRARFDSQGQVTLPAECREEALADRSGIVDVAPLLWRGALPGPRLEGGGTLHVRDMGPTRNRRLLERYPERTPYLLVRDRPLGRPLLLSYDEGIRRIWTDATAGTEGEAPR